MTKLRILTYNIYHGEAMDGGSNLERIAALIRREQADLVALQEVDDRTRRSGRVNQVVELGQRANGVGETGMHPFFAFAMEQDGGGYGEGVLSRFPFEKAVRHPLTAGAGFEPRAAAEVVVKIDPHTEITFLATHLDHVDDDTQRLSQARQLNQLFALDDGRTRILAGDFNALLDSRPIQELLGQWADANPSEGAPTWPSVEPQMRLDYIFYRPQAGIRVVESRVIDERQASDHRPVLAVFELDGAG